MQMPCKIRYPVTSIGIIEHWIWGVIPPSPHSSSDLHSQAPARTSDTMPRAPHNRSLYSFVVNLKKNPEERLSALPFSFEPNGGDYKIAIRHRPKRQDGSKVNVKYIAFSVEMGLKGNNFHLQGMLELDARLAVHTVAKWLNKSHVEIARSWNDLYKYTRKLEDETFVSGPYEFGTYTPTSPGKRNDIEEMTSMINDYASKGYSAQFIYHETYKQFPARIAGQSKGVKEMIDISRTIYKPKDDPSEIKLRPWQQKIVDILDKKPDSRKIYWVYDSKGNVGKSFLAMYLLKFKDAVTLSGKVADMAYAYKEERIVIFDVPRTSEENASAMYNMAEKLKNGFLFSAKYESKQLVFSAPHVIFFANFLPPTEPSPWSADRTEGTIFNLDEMLNLPEEDPFAFA
jgi:hypothetical protein